jgi:hypothetical protein
MVAPQSPWRQRGMNSLPRLLQRHRMATLAELGRQREFAEGVFSEWRDKYVATLCAWMWLIYEIEQRNKLFPNDKPMDAGEPSRSWCNAAVHLLTIPGRDIQDEFLRADEKKKNEMVSAVIADGGVENEFGHFVELPA